jgi:hypothetical protein
MRLVNERTPGEELLGDDLFELLGLDVAARQECHEVLQLPPGGIPS